MCQSFDETSVILNGYSKCTEVQRCTECVTGKALVHFPNTWYIILLIRCSLEWTALVFTIEGRVKARRNLFHSCIPAHTTTERL